MAGQSMTHCELWKALTQDPSSALIAQAKWVRAALVEHVEHCPHCDELNPSNHDGIAAAYEVLAGEDFEPVDTDDAFRLNASVESSVKHAVNAILLSNLPEGIASRASAWSALTLYQGIDAVAMLLERETRDRQPRQAVLSPTRGLIAGDQHIGRAEVAQEIRIVTGDQAVEGERLFDWLIEAARSFPHLFPGAIASSTSDHDVVLQVHGRTDLDVDLAEQWAPREFSGVRGVFDATGQPIPLGSSAVGSSRIL